MSIEQIIDKLAALLPTATAKIAISLAMLISVSLYANPDWVVLTLPWTVSDPQLLLSLLMATGTIAIGLILALVFVTLHAKNIENSYAECQSKVEKAEAIIDKEKKYRLKFYGHSDSPNIKRGIVVPIQIFENGEFSAPGDILCDEHRMTLEHVKDRHFCAEQGCNVELDMTEREQVLRAAEKLASRDIYQTLNTIPVEVDTYSHGI